MADKQNETAGVDTHRPSKNEDIKGDANYQAATTGAVLDAEHDGRLKENRDSGISKGTTAHSASAPNSERNQTNG
jgi:hypothetical protein